MRLKRVLPKDFSFFPETWLLPFELTEFRKEFNGNRSFIIKPEGNDKETYTTKSFDKVNQKSLSIAQRYIERPYLLNGQKFIMRFYVLIYGCDPLRAFRYNEGVVIIPFDKTVKNSTSLCTTKVGPINKYEKQIGRAHV